MSTHSHILDQLRRDRFVADQFSGHGMAPHCERCYRQGWNDSSAHAERIVLHASPTVSQSCEESAAASARAGGVISSPSDDGSAVTPAVRDSLDGLELVEIGLAELCDNAPERPRPEPIAFDVGGEP